MSSSRVSVYHQYTRSSSTGSCTSENLPPRTLARLAREVRNLQKTPPEGVRLVVDDDSGLPSNLGELMVELQGPQETPYESKYFLLKLVFSQDFPAAPPRGFFLTKLYHPNVDLTTGAICVNTLKKDWSAETTLSHVLAVIRCLLIVPFPESSLNDEAGKLFMESYDEYAKRARLMADVHGRATSAVAHKMPPGAASSQEQQQQEPIPQQQQQQAGSSTSGMTKPSTTEERGVLRSASDNSSRMAASSSSASAKKQPAVKGTPAGKKMSRKKSLKRL